MKTPYFVIKDQTGERIEPPKEVELKKLSYGVGLTVNGHVVCAVCHGQDSLDLYEASTLAETGLIGDETGFVKVAR